MPSNTYTTRDGKYVVIGANADSIFKRLMTAIGRADLADDSALADNAGRVQRTEELDEVIGAWVAGQDLDAALAVLARAQVPAGKIYDVADIVRDVHYQARGMLEQHRLEDGTRGQAARASCPSSPTRRAARAGSARGWARTPTKSCGELGYSAQDIAALRQGVVEPGNHAHPRNPEPEGRHDLQHRAGRAADRGGESDGQARRRLAGGAAAMARWSAW